MKLPISGITASLKNFEKHAYNISRAGIDNEDIANDISQIKIDKHSFSANTKAVKTKDETLGTIIDMLA